ncbi:hypothetical protein SCALM49S_01434 [Streptomyces californicus]
MIHGVRASPGCRIRNRVSEAPSSRKNAACMRRASRRASGSDPAAPRPPASVPSASGEPMRCSTTYLTFHR